MPKQHYQQFDYTVSAGYRYEGKLPDTSDSLNFGFDLDMLPPDIDSVSLNAVVASSEDLLAAIRDDPDIRVVGSPEDVQLGEELVNVYATLELDRKSVGTAHPELAKKLASKYFLDETEMSDLGVLDVYGEAIRAKLDEAVTRRMLPEFDTDFIFIPSELLQDNPQILQLIEFESDGKKIRLYNLSKTRVDEEHAAKLANAIREMSQLTGGLVFDRVPVMIIAPRDVPRFGEVSMVAEEIGGDRVNAYTLGTGAIIMNEALLTDEPDSSDASYSVGGGDLEFVVFHELAHAVSHSHAGSNPLVRYARAVGWRVETNNIGHIDSDSPVMPPEESAPSTYGSIKPGEDLAESATALFAGSPWKEKLTEDRKEAMKALYDEVHTGFIGPIHIRCREIDLQKLENKIGLERSGNSEKFAILPHVHVSIT